MTNVTSQHPQASNSRSRNQAPSGKSRLGNRARTKYVILAAAVLFAALIPLAPQAFAQGNTPHITTVDPASGKVNGTVTLAGTNLGKNNVTAVYLSDDKSDYKATLVEQSAEKLVFKVPQVKAGAYNLSVQIGTQILILPTHFTVE
jgi:hypothetical protein